ncbi:TetR/AcrR family transcriptional regulator [Streptomyces sp. NPDC003300]|uniref:TetR/AcrR family transcriptional regulator n=1 Tax=unclassified Streptomyces TaxID=2593676 RepID=UPI0033A37215
MSTEELTSQQRAAATKRRRSISRITTAALVLFDAHGWYGVVGGDIARDSGVSTATIDSYFPTKQAVVLGAYASRLLPIVDTAETALAQGSAADEMTYFILKLADVLSIGPALAVALLPAGRDIRSTKATVESGEIVIVDFDQLADLLGRLLVAHWRADDARLSSASDVAEFLLLGLLSRIVKHPEQSGYSSAKLLIDHLL